MKIDPSKLDGQFAKIAALGRPELANWWAKLTGRPVPTISTALLRLALTYELQAKSLGGLSRSAARQLEGSIGDSSVSQGIRPGMRLAREHGGTMHVVTIGEAGEIRWKDREWRSLSEVARAITGTRWSGPAFFGLRDARRAA